MKDQEFRDRSEQAIAELKSLLLKAEDAGDFEVEDEGGALHLSFDNPPGKFVISPNSAARQIWISALATSFKLDWSEGWHDWVYEKTGERFKVLVERLMNQQLGTQLVKIT